jgi:hypothetical protein
MIKENLFLSKKLGPFPFSTSTIKPLLTYLDGDFVIVCEGENTGGGNTEKEDLDGRGVEVHRDGDIYIGHWNKGKRDGLMRLISINGSD